MSDCDLSVVAAEMKAAAERVKITRKQMLTLAQFPAELRRLVKIEGHEYCLQYSQDELSTTKQMFHLSFSQEDRELPNEKIQQLLQQAFFDNQDVIRFPGNPIFGNHVLHMAVVQ